MDQKLLNVEELTNEKVWDTDLFKV